MAGWDYPFDVDFRDEDLARGCFRILRRTAARHYVEFSYYESRRKNGRVHFTLAFDCRPFMLSLAMGDFSLEMRAVSLIQTERRKKRLPLRLLGDIMWTSAEEPIAEQLSSQVPSEKHERVIRYLREYSLTLASYWRREISAADVVEAQHSLVTYLALDLAPGVDKSTPYPRLVEALKLPKSLEVAAKDLGAQRNKVKHRGKRHEAPRFAEQHLETAHKVAQIVTGCFLTPVPSAVAAYEADPKSIYRSLEMRNRLGEPKRFTRH